MNHETVRADIFEIPITSTIVRALIRKAQEEELIDKNDFFVFVEISTVGELSIWGSAETLIEARDFAELIQEQIYRNADPGNLNLGIDENIDAVSTITVFDKYGRRVVFEDPPPKR